MGTPDPSQHSAALTPAGEVAGPRGSDPSGVSTTAGDAKGPEMDALSKGITDITLHPDGSDTEVEDEPPTRDLPDDETVERRQELIDRIMRSFRATLESKTSMPMPSKEVAAEELKADREEPSERKASFAVSNDEQDEAKPASEMAAESPPPPAKPAKKSISILSRFMSRRSVAEDSASSSSTSSPSPPPPPPPSAGAPLAPAPATKEEARKGSARSSSPEKEKRAPAERSTDKLAAAVPVLKQKRAVPAPPPAARRAAGPPSFASAPAPGAGGPLAFSAAAFGQARSFSTLLPQPPQPPQPPQLQAFGGVPPPAQPVQPELAAPTAPLSTLSAASQQPGAGLRRRGLLLPEDEAVSEESPPPRLSSFRQTAVPSAPPPVQFQRRHVIPDSLPSSYQEEARAYSSTQSHNFLAAEPRGAAQPRFETLDFYSDVTQPQPPSHGPPGPTGAAAEEASFEFLRNMLPPGAFSGLDAPAANLQAGYGLQALGGMFHSHAFIPSSASYGAMAGPSAQVISPISLPDAVSPEATQTKHEQDDDGAIASDHDGRRKKPKRADKVGPGPSKKFACPYFKRNRAKYSKWTSCPGPGWDEVHRVKTHLYRRHALPIQCPRCWGVFKSDELLRSHLQQNPPCLMAENRAPVEGFTKDQEKRLRSRKKAQADTTDEDKWREIYIILFPDDDESSIPSPYYDPTDFSPSPPTSTGADNSLEDYTSFVRREMPTLVRRELETIMQEFSDVDPRFRSRIADIVLTLQPRLIDLYKQSQLPLSEWGPSNDSSRGNDTTPATGTDSSPTPANPSSTPATGADSSFTPATAASDGHLDPALGGYDGSGFTFDPNAGLGAWDGPVIDEGFSWDEEFDNLLNPSLFMPQGGGQGLDASAYQYVPQPGPSGVPRTWG